MSKDSDKIGARWYMSKNGVKQSKCLISVLNYTCISNYQNKDATFLGQDISRLRDLSRNNVSFLFREGLRIGVSFVSFRDIVTNNAFRHPMNYRGTVCLYGKPQIFPVNSCFISRLNGNAIILKARQREFQHVLIVALRGEEWVMPDFPQFSLFIIFQNIKRFSIGSCNEILNR